MIVCEICGKSDFKNTQGLRGHKTFVHGITGSSKTPSTPLATEQRLSSLEEILDITGQDTELPVSITLQELDGRLELSEQRTELLTEQLKGTTEKVIQLARQLGELSRVTEKRLSELRSLIHEAVSVIGEDLYLLLVGIDGHKHDPETGSVTFTVKSPLADRLNIALKQAHAWKFTSQVAEMFSPVARMAKGSVEQLGKPAKPKAKKGQPAEEPKTIQGKTDKPGYRYLKHLDLSVKE